MNNFLIEVLVRSSILSLVWIVICALVRKRSAALQHAVLIFGLFGMLLLPILHVTLHEIRWQILQGVSSQGHLVGVLIPGTARLSGEPANPVSNWTLPFGLTFMGLIWMVGTLLILARYLLGITQLRKWTREGTRLPSKLGSVPLISSKDVDVPMTAWIGHSVILVPLTWQAWADERKQAALLHELAHVERQDWLTQLLGRLVTSVLWPNPVVWILAQKSRFLAERAADDYVLSSGITPTKYAQVLLETAREIHATLPQLSVCMAQGPNVARRIELILHTNTERGKASRKGLILGAILLLGTSIPAAVIAITGQELPRAKDASVGKTGQSTVIIDCCVLKPGVLFSETGLKIFAETKSTKPGKQTGPDSVEGLVYAFPTDSCKELTSKWEKAGRIQSHPVVLTRAGQEAKISTSDGVRSSQTLKFLPTIDSKGQMVMGFGYDLKQAGSTSFNEYITFSSKIPGTVVISKSTGGKKPKEVLALISVRLGKG